MHRLEHVLRRDVDVLARFERPLENDEAVARRMGLEPADVEVHLLGEPEAVPPDLNQVAGSDEALDVTLERRAFLAGDPQDLDELAQARGVMHAVAHEREHLVGRQHCS
jgi:hypothetical protein